MDEFERHGIAVVSGRDACARALRSAGLTSDPGGGSPSVLLRDGDDHTRVRAVLREIIAGLEPFPAALQAAIEATVAGLGMSFDLVRDFARPVAGAVTSAVLGVPLDDVFLDHLEATTANLDVFGGADRAGQASAFRLAVQLSRTPAGPGGLTALRKAHAAGRLDEDELVINAVVLAHAVYENSLNFLACAGLELATSGPRTVRELVAAVCPARYVLRFGPDGPVAISLADGLPFGLGRHACPGSGVALAEAEIALTALAKHLGGGCEVRDVRWKTHAVFHGLDSAQVVVSGKAG
ncbi:cytochrome P450 [Amycolatopsis vancoresmycina]|uniref:Cytochrome P450 n=1 Tax=Amycolatopsis vancoresmycina DSM 44592 TaxID=1292037 RepID=R1HSR1_9PSEU|nr:cytochrome P450 [Amycolatopsis vancoresmycina]EOD63366.1 cytochrome P450 [Amycolatopsis vancoresmycina DSM 44592]